MSRGTGCREMENTQFSRIYHQVSKDVYKNGPVISVDEKDWLDDWKTVYYKTYPRFEKIKLKAEVLHADFFDLIVRRESRRDFTKEAVDLRTLSLLLKYSCGVTGIVKDVRSRRAYPSGGARYPIEIYPIVFRSSNDLEAGIYHYSVKEHMLDVVWKRSFSENNIDMLFTYPWVKNASMCILMTAVFWRTENKYREKSYEYILLEAGHISQNVYLVSEALGIKCTAMAGLRPDKIEKLLDIDGFSESVIYSLVVGT